MDLMEENSFEEEKDSFGKAFHTVSGVDGAML